MARFPASGSGPIATSRAFLTELCRKGPRCSEHEYYQQKMLQLHLTVDNILNPVEFDNVSKVLQKRGHSVQ